MASKANTAQTEAAIQQAHNLANQADTTAVKLTGDQHVSGLKTFDDLRINSKPVRIGLDSSAVDEHGVAVGSGAHAYGDYSIAIGCGAQADNRASIAIGASAWVMDVNQIQLGAAGGEFAPNFLGCKVNLSISSDERDKTDIIPLEKALAFINKVKPIQYVDNHRKKYMLPDEERTEEQNELIRKYGLCHCYDDIAYAAGEKKGQRKRVGVRAQQVQWAMQEVYGTTDYANLVNDNLHDVREREELPEGVESQLTVAYSEFIPFLIQAVQELSRMINEQKKLIESLRL